MSQRVLVVDDDAAILKAIKRALTGAGFEVDIASSGASCLEMLQKQPVDCLLVDLGMPEMDGFAVMEEALQESLARSVIVVTGEGSIPIAVDAMRAGASDFITKPIDFEKLSAAIERTMGVPQGSPIDIEKRLAWRDQYAPGFIGQDPKMLAIFGIIERIADTECNVLVTGASGAGKELVARAVHAASDRRDKPFVAVNCAAIPGELMESEIFGHAKGAFTGAVEARQGKFQVADGGTLFLDEIGEMDMALQSKFLRVIQEREFTPVGETKPRKADVRIVSATNRDLLARAGEGHFREDLYYRLNVIPIQIPALQDRPKDVTLLADFFIKRACKSYGRKATGMDPEVSRILTRHKWPGNVRELENLIQRIVILKADEGPITRDDLPDEMVGRTSTESVDATDMELPEEGIDIKKVLAGLETRMFLEALKRSNGNKAKAAAMVGLKRTTFIERCNKLGLDKF